MKALVSLCAAIVASIVLANEAAALNAPQAHLSVLTSGIVKVSHHRHAGGLFNNWCAYNCYRVSRYARPPLGRYGYSQYAYDQDLPFRYRWDRDASPIDNALALPQYYIGSPLLSAGERRW